MNRATTSASNIFRRVLCPGSHWAEHGLPEQENEYSSEGTWLHGVMSDTARRSVGRNTIPPKLLPLIESAEYQEERFIELSKRVLHIPPDAQAPVILRDVDMEFNSYPGHADLIHYWRQLGKAAILDYKFGFIEVISAKDNEQLASYGVMLAAQYPCDGIAVGIAQPRAPIEQRLTMAHYDALNIARAAGMLSKAHAAALEQNAPRIPGERQCANCKAKLVCPEYRGLLAPALGGPRDINDVLTCSDSQLAEMLTACRFAARIQDHVIGEIAARISLGGMEGWELEETGNVRECTDTSRAYRILKSFFSDDEGFTPDAFMGCLKLKWGDLEELFRKLTGFPAKRAKATLTQLLQPVTNLVPKSPTPKRKK